MPTHQVTESYVLGIREGRSLFKQLRSEGSDPVALAPAIIDNIRQTMRGFTGEMRDTFRGELDFWKHKLETR